MRDCTRMKDIVPLLDWFKDYYDDGFCDVWCGSEACRDNECASERRGKEYIMQTSSEVGVLKELKKLSEKPETRNLNAYDVVNEVCNKYYFFLLDAKTESSKRMFEAVMDLLQDVLCEIQRANEEEYGYSYGWSY